MASKQRLLYQFLYCSVSERLLVCATHSRRHLFYSSFLLISQSKCISFVLSVSFFIFLLSCARRFSLGFVYAVYGVWLSTVHLLVSLNHWIWHTIIWYSYTNRGTWTTTTTINCQRIHHSNTYTHTHTCRRIYFGIEKHYNKNREQPTIDATLNDTHSKRMETFCLYGWCKR